MHSFGEFATKRFAKRKINIVERLINKLMRSGQGKKKLGGHVIRGRMSTGKKLQTMQAVDKAFDIIYAKTKKNPIQVLVNAIENATPNEDVTRIKKGAISYTETVDVSPYTKLNEAIKNIALATFATTFNSKQEFANALAEEIILASKADNKSYAIRRKDEIERIAKASR